jgi:hypothetical protein
MIPQRNEQRIQAISSPSKPCHLHPRSILLRSNPSISPSKFHRPPIQIPSISNPSPSISIQVHLSPSKSNPIPSPIQVHLQSKPSYHPRLHHLPISGNAMLTTATQLGMITRRLDTPRTGNEYDSTVLHSNRFLLDAFSSTVRLLLPSTAYPRRLLSTLPHNDSMASLV